MTWKRPIILFNIALLTIDLYKNNKVRAKVCMQFGTNFKLQLPFCVISGKEFVGFLSIYLSITLLPDSDSAEPFHILYGESHIF